MKKRNGFTLIELLVVIAIIAILAAILFPVFAAAREKARETTSVSNDKQIGLAIIMYDGDYDENYPYTSFYGIDVNGITRTYSWRTAVQPYIKSLAAFGDPSNPYVTITNQASGWFVGSNGFSNDNTPISYAANSDGMRYEPVGTLYENQTGTGGSNVNPMPKNITPMTSWASWLPGGGATPSMNLAGVKSPASLILVGEEDNPFNWGDVQWDLYDNANCVEPYPTPPTKTSDCSSPPNIFSGHNGKATYVFCDGHVKALSIVATVTPVNLWDNMDISNNAPAPAAAVTYAGWAQAYWNLH